MGILCRQRYYRNQNCMAALINDIEVHTYTATNRVQRGPRVAHDMPWSFAVTPI